MAIVRITSWPLDVYLLISTPIDGEQTIGGNGRVAKGVRVWLLTKNGGTRQSKRANLLRVVRMSSEVKTSGAHSDLLVYSFYRSVIRSGMIDC